MASQYNLLHTAARAPTINNQRAQTTNLHAESHHSFMLGARSVRADVRVSGFKSIDSLAQASTLRRTATFGKRRGVLFSHQSLQIVGHGEVKGNKEYCDHRNCADGTKKPALEGSPVRTAAAIIKNSNSITALNFACRHVLCTTACGPKNLQNDLVAGCFRVGNLVSNH